MADEREFKVTIVTDDQSTKNTQEAARATRNLDKAQRDLKKSTDDTNLAFLAEIEAIDKIHSGMQKIVGAVGELNLVNDKQLKQLRQLAAVLDLVVGSYEILLAVRKLDLIDKLTHIDLTNTQTIALGGMAAAMAGVGFAILAVNAQTDEQRALFSVLTGVTWGLAAAEFALAIAKVTEATLGFGTIAAIGLITAALVSITTAVASAEASAQTGPGEVKIVTRTGNVTMHEGERVSRGRSGNNFNITFNSAIPSTSSERRMTRRMFERAIREVV